MKTRTLTILKPDCVGRNLIGRVVDHLESKGFEILAAKMIYMTKEVAGGFYAVHRERGFFNDLVEFMTSGRCVVMVLENENAVEYLREVIGATDPAEAADGTVRKLYAESKQNNIIHASDSDENAKIEIGFFFSERELIGNGAV